MVAITVILAAVIGTFVLNLGGNLQSTPQAQLSIDSTSSNGDFEISHNGGDTLQWSNLNIQVSSGSISQPSGEFSVGGSVTRSTGLTGGNNEITVTLIHNPSETILVETTITV